MHPGDSTRPRESAYLGESPPSGELRHCYGPTVRVLARPYLLTLLGRLGSADVVQPAANELLESCYRSLFAEVFSSELPLETVDWPTRMTEAHPGAAYSGVAIRRQTSAVVVDIARAGTFPSHLCYDMLNRILDPASVRQDHLIMNRRTDESGSVVGADLHGSKIGGDVDGRVMFIPDPMAATGASIGRALSHYRENVGGSPSKVVTVHLIVTPNYIRAMRERFPEVVIYAIRLDRGLSPAKVLNTVPGTMLEQENGLDGRQYIVPGGGGFGEILNNSFV